MQDPHPEPEVQMVEDYIQTLRSALTDAEEILSDLVEVLTLVGKPHDLEEKARDEVRGALALPVPGLVGKEASG